MMREKQKNRSKFEVRTHVSWTHAAAANREDDRKVSIPIFVQPEIRLPNISFDAAEKFNKKHDCDLFWLIPRTEDVSKATCKLKEIEASTTNCGLFAYLTPGGGNAQDGMLKFDIKIPCIENILKIREGDSSFLEWKRMIE